MKEGDPGQWRRGCGFVLLFLALMLGYAAVHFGTADSDLSHVGGAPPARVIQELGTKYTEGSDDLVWDIRKRVVSTFEVGSHFGTGEAKHLDGGFQILVPEGCADRTVRWKISADGESFGSGQVRWQQRYEVKPVLRVHGHPRTVTLDASWDGGTESCPSFSLAWHDPEILWEFDIDIFDPDYYP